MSTPAPRTFKSRALTYLSLHDVVNLDGRLHRVAMVNECRARCLPLKRKVVSYVPQTGVNAGQTVSFERQEDGVNISPDSQLEIVGHWNPATESVKFKSSVAPFVGLDPATPGADQTVRSLASIYHGQLTVDIQQSLL